MSKRLKRRILDICGLNNLSREEKARKARQILSDSDYKQNICNEIIGASYRDVERTLKDIATLSVPKEEQERRELQEECPQKLDPDLVTARKKKPTRLIPVLDIVESTRLVNATTSPIKEKVSVPKEHTYYTPEEVDAIIAGNYNPADFH